MKKALIYTLSLALLLSLAACHKPQADQPAEPQEPEIQKTEPVSTEPTTPPVEAAPQEEPKQTEPTEPVEVKEGNPESGAAEPPADTTPEQSQEPVSPPPAQQEPVEQQTQPSGGGQQDPQGPTPGYNPWENDDSNVVIDTRTEEQKQADLEETRRASEAVTGTIQAGGLGTQKIDGHDDLGDYVLNGKGGKYYPALGITLPVSYDGTTTNGAPPQTAEEQELAKEAYEAANRSSEHHTESWSGIKMGG